MVTNRGVSEIVTAPWFQAAWGPCLVLDPALRIRAVNEALLRAVGRSRDELAEQHMFDAFPANPDEPTADGVTRLTQSLERVLSRGQREWMGGLRYDVPGPRGSGSFVPKVCALMNAPITRDGRTVGIVHHIQDVTEILGGQRALLAGDRLSGALNAAADQLEREFPLATIDTVLSILVHSHRVVLRELGAPHVDHTVRLARLRLEMFTLQPARSC